MTQNLTGTDKPEVETDSRGGGWRPVWGWFRPALEGDDRFWVPAYLGPSGWLGLDLQPSTDFDEVAELLEESFRATAPSRLVMKLQEADR